MVLTDTFVSSASEGHAHFNQLGAASNGDEMVRAFILKARWERCTHLFRNPRHRHKFTDEPTPSIVWIIVFLQFAWF